MNMDTVLKIVENLRSSIENWGITNEGLWVAGALALIIFVFSLREVLTWFLKIQTIAEDIRYIRREIKDLKQFMQVEREVHEIAMKAQEANAIPETQEAPSKRFPLDN
jgi:hypothetical protein